MNYQHLYHAGNFADIIKHAVLITLIQQLQKKDKPLCILDTHAGIGQYNLHSVESQKRCEYQHGLSKLMAQNPPEGALPWLKQLVAGMNTASDVFIYPGSPVIANALLRPEDRLILIEKHPVFCAQLRRTLGKNPQIAIHERDAYEALAALLPPEPRRGLVLIDPPYENKEELFLLRNALQKALQRWPDGVFMAWYPIKATAWPNDFYSSFVTLPCNEVMTIEIRVFPDSVLGLMGSGLMIINPPWKSFHGLKRLTEQLSKLLSERSPQRFSCRLLKEEGLGHPT